MKNIEDAWNAYFVEKAGEDIDDLRADGWKTIADCAEQMNVTVDSARHLLARSRELQRRPVKVQLDGKFRKINMYRPK